jgi:hypothetical protein
MQIGHCPRRFGVIVRGLSWVRYTIAIVPFMDRICFGRCGCLCYVRMWGSCRSRAADSWTGCSGRHRQLIEPWDMCATHLGQSHTQLLLHSVTVPEGLADNCNCNWLAVVLVCCGLDGRESAFDSSKLFMAWCLITPLKFRGNYIYHLLYR